MSNSMTNIIYTLIYSVPATLIAIILHEVAHALVSYWCGDKGVRADGRLSLNPLKHLDLMGTICLICFHFGWAKPVRVNTRNYKHKKLDFCLVALAGPVMNFIVAFISVCLMYLVTKYSSGSAVASYFYFLFYYIAALNIGLGVFNLIPIPPLDGSNVLLTFLPDQASRFFAKYRNYFMIGMMILLYFGAFSNVLAVIQQGMMNGMCQMVLKLFGHTVTGGYV
ncbi:MAG: site-2 protease family protein [Lachnospira sp.]|nr:site-2 protease family protein [Lachnospira sp.]